jgi:GT2 family glycosyltransferase
MIIIKENNILNNLISYPKVSIIILNWNGYKDSIECLESLYQISYQNYNVILVDNNSADNSIDEIKEYCIGKNIPASDFFTYTKENKPITVFEYTKEESENIENKESELEKLSSDNKLIVIKNDKNYGFAEGNNIGIRYTLKAQDPDYILLLNNDIVVDKNFLTELVKISESDIKIGVAGPKNIFYEKNGRKDVISFLGGKLNLKHYPGYFHIGENLIDSQQYSQGFVECDWITGASLLLKVKEIPIKFLNSNLFFGCEDADLGIRLKKNGFKIIAVLNSKIWHKCGVSRKKSSKKKWQGLKRDTKTNLAFLKMHNNNYYIFLPLYFLQLLLLILSNLFKKILNK